MDKNQRPEGIRTTRRGSLLTLGGLLASSLGGAAWKAATAEDAEAAGVGPAAVAAGLVSCVLTPEQTEGPYYLEDQKIRRDIRDGHKGVRLDLRATVVDASTCKPVKGALVEIWHCDAAGLYSGFGAVRPAGRSCAAASARMRRASPASRPSTPAGIKAAPSISTSRCTSAAPSSTRASSISTTP